jgi:oxygen-independent coproporphyrinogen-3 oxidase
MEALSPSNQFNEYILTRLRHYQGVNSEELREVFGSELYSFFIDSANAYVVKNLLELKNGCYILTNNGKVLADLITSDLMID